MVTVEESPQEDDVMDEDNEEESHSDADVSSTAVSPEPIPIPAPVRASMHNQKAVKGRGTKDCPYDLDFAPSVCQSCGLSPESR